MKYSHSKEFETKNKYSKNSILKYLEYISKDIIKQNIMVYDEIHISFENSSKTFTIKEFIDYLSPLEKVKFFHLMYAVKDKKTKKNLLSCTWRILYEDTTKHDIWFSSENQMIVDTLIMEVEKTVNDLDNNSITSSTKIPKVIALQADQDKIEIKKSNNTQLKFTAIFSLLSSIIGAIAGSVITYLITK